MAIPEAKSILCDFWYARELPEVVDDFEVVIVKRFGQRLSRSLLANRWLRCAAFVWVARTYGAVVPNWYSYGRLYCLVNAITFRKTITLIECIDFDIAGQRAIVRLVYGALCRFLLGPAMRVNVRAIQLMTEGERHIFADRYGLPLERLHYIPWPLSGWERPGLLPSTPKAKPALVFASGRAACDWDTLFAAQRLGGWRLAVACSERDLPHVRALNADGAVEVHCELPTAEHDHMLSCAQVYAISLREQGKSSGQVRLGDAIAANVPVVGTLVQGIEGYLIDGKTGMAVPPADSAALAREISSLLAQPARATALASSARKHALSWSKGEYFESIARMLIDHDRS